jgi:toxin ParE1/3/4
MSIVWLPVAVQDVIHIRTYIADRDLQSANKIGQRIDRAISNLSSMPNMGRPGRLFGTRELAISGTPFLAVYRVKNDRIEILRILHGRQPFPESINQ